MSSIVTIGVSRPAVAQKARGSETALSAPASPVTSAPATVRGRTSSAASQTDAPIVPIWQSRPRSCAASRPGSPSQSGRASATVHVGLE